MQYNLLDTHKNVAQWLVEQYRAEKLGEDFFIAIRSEGIYVVPGANSSYPIDTEKVPVISFNTLKALAGEKLILLEEIPPGPGIPGFACGLLGRIFTAVDTNFGEIEADLKPRSEDLGGLTLSVPKFSQLLARDFSLDELDDLLFNMGIESADISGNSLSEKAREIVKYAQRHGRLLELLIRAAKSRSKTDWSQLYE